ncbi:MAG: hypothetical protein KBG68_05175 [Prevotella sp.]|nr:hypothetical protein [Prevotella sp.]
MDITAVIVCGTAATLEQQKMRDEKSISQQDLQHELHQADISETEFFHQYPKVL